jgi:hypothetical protein
VRLNVKDVINFHKTVPESGTTLFIALMQFRLRMPAVRYKPQHASRRFTNGDAVAQVFVS